jgi:hypothetical protein
VLVLTRATSCMKGNLGPASSDRWPSLADPHVLRSADGSEGDESEWGHGNKNSLLPAARQWGHLRKAEPRMS